MAEDQHDQHDAGQAHEQPPYSSKLLRVARGCGGRACAAASMAVMLRHVLPSAEECMRWRMTNGTIMHDPQAEHAPEHLLLVARALGPEVDER